MGRKCKDCLYWVALKGSATKGHCYYNKFPQWVKMFDNNGGKIIPADLDAVFCLCFTFRETEE